MASMSEAFSSCPGKQDAGNKSFPQAENRVSSRRESPLSCPGTGGTAVWERHKKTSPQMQADTAAERRDCQIPLLSIRTAVCLSFLSQLLRCRFACAIPIPPFRRILASPAFRQYFPSYILCRGTDYFTVLWQSSLFCRVCHASADAVSFCL